MRSSLSIFTRWFVTWPVLVILGINIENLADALGISGILPENWSWLMSMLTWAYETATQGWVFNIALFLAGAIVYEWIAWTAKKMDHRFSWFRARQIKSDARVLSKAFLKDGFARRVLPVNAMIDDINNRLCNFDLPPIPDDISVDERINRVFGRYLFLIGENDFDFARDFLKKAIQDIKGEGQPHLSQTTSEEGTPR